MKYADKKTLIQISSRKYYLNSSNTKFKLIKMGTNIFRPD